MKRRPVPAAEKYLEGPRPVCDCHGMAMRWHANARFVSGGSWRCAERRREHDRRWKRANPAKRREDRRRWKGANPEKVREYHRLYYKANTDKVAALNRRWREANPEARAMLARRRRARKASALTVPFTPEQLADRMAFWGNRCWMCGGPFEAVDHVIPIARGGSDCLSNLRPACRSCNSSKGAKPPELVLVGRVSA